MILHRAFLFRTFFGGAIPHVVGKRKIMTTLEYEKRRVKWAWIVLIFAGALSAIAVAFAIVSAIQEGVDPLEARISALERTVAELQDERRP